MEIKHYKAGGRHTEIRADNFTATINHLRKGGYNFYIDTPVGNNMSISTRITKDGVENCVEYTGGGFIINSSIQLGGYY